MDYFNRLKIPVLVGDSFTKFYTKCGTHVATGYNRIVIGARGPYIEFSLQQINKDNMHIPAEEQWRVESNISFYIEYRTSDACNVKVYYQRKLVNYADYKLTFYYISPFDLKTDFLDDIIEPLKKNVEFTNDKFF